LIAALAAGAPPAAQPRPPFVWAVPKGWRTETIPFPLDFAPALKHRGLEELRFSPGMFKPGAPDFWSYGFIWWLEGEAAPSAAVLGRELALYFRGLSEAVGKGKYSFDASRFKARLRADGDSMTGQIDTYDAFKTGRPLTLNVRLRSQRCGRDTALLVALSPADPKASTWNDLNELTATFRCPPV
jgi:hypothetical protein